MGWERDKRKETNKEKGKFEGIGKKRAATSTGIWNQILRGLGLLRRILRASLFKSHGSLFSLSPLFFPLQPCLLLGI